MKMHRLLSLGLAGLLVIGVAACGDDDDDGGGEAETNGDETNGEEAGGGGGGQAGDIRIEVVSHGQASDPFWSVVVNGVEQAASDTGAEVNYQAPSTFDMVEMSQLIDAAVATEPDGLVVSVPDADALSDSIQSAVDAGIPVITMNSGSDVFEDLGALTHVGQDELIAGTAAGERMAEEGVTNALCINQEVGNAGLDARCEGFTNAIEDAGGSVEVLAVDLNDPTDAQQRVEAAISSNQDVNGILALGPTGSTPTLAALQESGRLGDITLATFDLSPEVLEAIDAGDMLFAIDQQQYLQGYLPIVFLSLYNQFLLVPGGGQPVLTGPGFVTQETAAEVLDLSEQGIR
jgi:simple sugar transport system substrate-binding protein